jgi:hypothetical protein
MLPFIGAQLYFFGAQRLQLSSTAILTVTIRVGLCGELSAIVTSLPAI